MTASSKRAAAGADGGFQRWQFATLSMDADPPPVPQVPTVTAEERARVLEAARAEGYGAGFASGRADARDAVEAEAAHLRTVAAALDAARVSLQDDTAQALLALAADIAQHLLRAELAANPAAMLPAVREAIDLAGSGAHPQLLLNPGDVDFVRRHLGEELAGRHWRFVEDARIEPGGCRVETADGVVDATLAARWRRAAAALAVAPPDADTDAA
ncbi:MAG: flagellar assembly protein FliH [Burkholderiales bacterium]|nr:flagellar assembly protein FliH [Burkholderiales bacterium]